MNQLGAAATDSPRPRSKGSELDDAAVYPKDRRAEILSDVDVIRESFSMLPAVAIEELL